MSAALNIKYDYAPEESDDMHGRYHLSLRLVERLHRMLLDVIKAEFERMGRNEVNSVQALLLYNIGDAELTAGELTSRGYYVGSNVSYNLKKLVEAGYIHHERSQTDRRSVRVRLTEKGRSVAKIVGDLYERQLRSIEQVGGLGAEALASLNASLMRLERFWADQIRYRL